MYVFNKGDWFQFGLFNKVFKLTPPQAIIFNIVLSFSNSKIGFTGGYEYVLRAVEISHKTYLRARNDLINIGLINEPKGKKAPLFINWNKFYEIMNDYIKNNNLIGQNDPYINNIYIGQNDLLENNNSQSVNLIGQNDLLEPDKLSNDIGQNDLYIKQDITSIKHNKTQNTTKESGESLKNNDILDKLFNDFWNAYPKKTKYKACKDWFIENQNIINDNLVLQMIDTIESFKKSSDWTKEKGRFIPSPINWLKNQSWNDKPYKSDNEPDWLDEIINNLGK